MTSKPCAHVALTFLARNQGVECDRCGTRWRRMRFHVDRSTVISYLVKEEATKRKVTRR